MSAKSLFFLCTLALAGCSSGGSTGLIGTIFNDIMGDQSDEVPENLADTITRSQVDALGVAILRFEESRDAQRNLLVALRQNHVIRRTTIMVKDRTAGAQ